VKHGLNGKCSNVVKEMVTNSAVNFDGQAKRQVLIMDEVDGMSGGDRGGVADLIQSMKARVLPTLPAAAQQLLQTSKVPIVCICNDAWSQKLRTLKGHCLELVYTRPTKQQIRGRMVAIATKEGLNVSETAMDALIENCHSDIRLILNTLQARSSVGKTKRLTPPTDAPLELRLAFLRRRQGHHDEGPRVGHVQRCGQAAFPRQTNDNKRASSPLLPGRRYHPSFFAGMQVPRALGLLHLQITGKLREHAPPQC